MRATFSIPDEIISEVQKMTGEKSRTKAIVVAMQEFIRQRKLREFAALKGKIQVDDRSEELECLEMEEMKEDDTRWRIG
jgi:hypothetical protein